MEASLHDVLHPRPGAAAAGGGNGGKPAPGGRGGGRGGGLPLRRVLEVAGDVAAGLALLHPTIVHRRAPRPAGGRGGGPFAVPRCPARPPAPLGARWEAAAR
jgi:hypothetical protein